MDHRVVRCPVEGSDGGAQVVTMPTEEEILATVPIPEKAYEPIRAALFDAVPGQGAEKAKKRIAAFLKADAFAFIMWLVDAKIVDHVVFHQEGNTITVSSKDATSHIILPNEPDHFVTFDEKGWFVEHSIACRIAGTLGTCEYNDAVRKIADMPDCALGPYEPDSDLFGRWCITEIDSEGLPILERAGG